MSTRPTAQAVETLILQLDPTVPLAEQVCLGNYDFVDPVITPGNFKLTLPAGRRRITLYDPEGFTSSEAMIRRMATDGRVPATLDDALAIGIQHPERQLQNPIVFLGRSWRDASTDLLVPVLARWVGGGRELKLLRFDHVWLHRCRFAAVREK